MGNEPGEGMELQSILDEIKKNIREVYNLSVALKTSLGPSGMDKVIKRSKENILITNDGATILKNSKFKSEILKIIRDLSVQQDNEVGDGTTGVILLASSFLINTIGLLEKGIHPARICEGFEHACDVAVGFLEEISQDFSKKIDIFQSLKSVAETSINSKLVNRSKKRISEICVKSVLAIADLRRREANLDLIRVDGCKGGRLENTILVDGIVLRKDFSSPQMPSIINEARICIITSPLEPQKPKIKHSLEIRSSKNFKELIFQEQKYFQEMIEQVKNCGANLLLCQWGFDDEANHLLVRNKISAIRWISGTDIEIISLLTGAQISSRFCDLTSSSLGYAGTVKELTLSIDREKFILIQDSYISNSLTIFIRGATEIVINEAKRSIFDALYAVRNTIRDNRIVFGGGASEMACSNRIFFEAERNSGIKSQVFEAYSNALKIIPSTLAENAGADSVLKIQELALKQVQTSNFSLGIDGLNGEIMDMSKLKIMESLLAKQNQIINATQIANNILRIDRVIDTQLMP